MMRKQLSTILKIGVTLLGLAIVIAIYRNRRTPLVDEYASMKE